MPTGYTARLHDVEDTTAADYLLHCARAFDIHSRDHHEFVARPVEPDTSYHEEKLAAAQTELNNALAWSDEEATRLALDAHNAEIDRRAKRALEREQIRERYDAVKQAIVQWQPPTATHLELRKFAIDQIDQSIEHDCRPVGDEPEPLDGSTFRARSIESAAASVKYHADKLNLVRQSTAERNEWVQQLVDSAKALPA